jgi:AraC family transcriptional regulator of adaptative response/methylated-DNA-[protein]-cysteine methyltransferase
MTTGTDTDTADGILTAHGHDYHYRVMRRAIAEIDAAEAPLRLDELAARMGMSAAHFQRLFTAWVGVSPKRYQQYLALDHARALLRAQTSTLEAAGAAGLSGGGRLHDLFLRWEAMSPGAYARHGAGLTIRYGHFDSPFGKVLAMGTARGLCGLAFTEEVGAAAAWADMTARWPEADFVKDPKALSGWVGAAFGDGGAAKVHMIGAPFQIKVWEALLAVPSGHVTTYGEIAHAIGQPRAARAVGTAVGRNPVSWLIPCHRALRKSGGLGGYHWGLPVKRAMLAWESARADTGAPNA